MKRIIVILIVLIAILFVNQSSAQDAYIESAEYFNSVLLSTIDNKTIPAIVVVYRGEKMIVAFRHYSQFKRTTKNVKRGDILIIHGELDSISYRHDGIGDATKNWALFIYNRKHYIHKRAD